jgi:hypothetical protein
MSNEDLKPTVPQMLRMTGHNTQQFMEQIAIHIEKLEVEVARLEARVQELEETNQNDAE